MPRRSAHRLCLGLAHGQHDIAPRGHVAVLSNYIDPGHNFVTCPNQDVVYGLGYFSLDEEPVVAEGFRQSLLDLCTL
jgi:hypothetical protein